MIVDNAVYSLEARTRGHGITWSDSAETVAVDSRNARDLVVQAVSVMVKLSEI